MWLFTFASDDVTHPISVSVPRILKLNFTVYSNSVLATLNARQIIRGIGETSDELSFSIQAVSKTGQGNVGSTVLLFRISFWVSFDRVKEIGEHLDKD